MTAFKPGTERCWREPRLYTLPEQGAVNVPRNAKLWLLDDGQRAPWRLEGGDAPWSGLGAVVAQDDLGQATAQRFDVGELAANHAYVYHGDGFGPDVQFTTGSFDDTIAPGPPVITVLAIRVRTGMRAVAIPDVVLESKPDPDAAMLHVTFTSGSQSLSMIVLPGEPHRLERYDGAAWRENAPAMCHSTLALVPGSRVSVSVRAIDLAGNEGAATDLEVEVEAVERSRLSLFGLVLLTLITLGWGLRLQLIGRQARRRRVGNAS